MRRSTEILYVSDAIGIEGFLAGLSPTVTEVYVSTLVEGEGRLAKYNAIAASVLEAALDHPPVTFAIAGHPLVFVYHKWSGLGVENGPWGLHGFTDLQVLACPARSPNDRGNRWLV
jgi:hypothetical protein